MTDDDGTNDSEGVCTKFSHPRDGIQVSVGFWLPTLYIGIRYNINNIASRVFESYASVGVYVIFHLYELLTFVV
jgi:hypothetical protein